MSAVFDLIEYRQGGVGSSSSLPVDALEFGAPPHGGIAFGLDRLVMLMAGADNLSRGHRVPKTATASDLLTVRRAPASAAAQRGSAFRLKSST